MYGDIWKWESYSKQSAEPALQTEDIIVEVEDELVELPQQPSLHLLNTAWEISDTLRWYLSTLGAAVEADNYNHQLAKCDAQILLTSPLWA